MLLLRSERLNSAGTRTISKQFHESQVEQHNEGVWLVFVGPLSFKSTPFEYLMIDLIKQRTQSDVIHSSRKNQSSLDCPRIKSVLVKLKRLTGHI